MRTEHPYGGAGVALLEALKPGPSSFTVAQARRLAPSIGIEPRYIAELLHRLNSAGLIRRIKRGTYLIGGAQRGETHPFVVGMRLVEGSAVSGWAAINHHGFTDQIPLVTTLTTTRKTTTPSMREKRMGGRSTWTVGSLEFEVVTVVPHRFFGYDEVWFGEDRVTIFDRERTVLDCFAMPRKFGGIGEGLAIVTEHLRELDVERLVKYGDQYGSDAVARRLGFALEAAGTSVSLLEPLRANVKTGTRSLDPTRPRGGPIDRKWRISNNLLARRKS